MTAGYEDWMKALLSLSSERRGVVQMVRRRGSVENGRKEIEKGKSGS